jgi:hopanoid biosynthesis associated RND transporter like protein HpnN
VVLGTAVMAAGLVFYTATHLSVDTNTEHLISAQLPWRRAVEQLDRAFPQLSNTLAVVIDASTPELADDAQRRLVGALAPRTDLFEEVFAIETEPFFRRNGLLYLEPQQLKSLADALTRAQPFLGTLDENPSLASLFTLLTRALQRPEAGFDLSPALGQIASAVAAVNEGRFHRLSWAALTAGDAGAPGATTRRFIEIAPHFEFDRLLPAGRSIDAIRATAKRLQLSPEYGVTVRLTGSVAMEHEELLTAVTGAGVSLSAALVMVGVLLYLALRSARLVVAAVLTLACGLTFTAAFAAAAIGHLNLISVAFGVLYVGLGIDYALYVCMEYRELLGRGEPSRTAMPAAARRMGGFMVVCAATTSIGFLAFIPTSFTAIAELGAISAFGMLMSLLMSITLLPALVELMPPDPKRVQFRPGTATRVLEWPYRHARALWIGAGVAACGALALLPRVHFDPDPLDLRDPKSESVATYRELLKDPDTPTLTLSALTADLRSAQALADRLATLPSVKQALTLQSFVPENQDTKLAIIDDIALALGPNFTESPGPDRPRADPRDERSLSELIEQLRVFVKQASAAQSRNARVLLEQLQRFQATLASRDPSGRQHLLGQLRETLLGTLPLRLRELRDALQAQPVTLADLPRPLVRRWLSPEGLYRVEAWPKEILDRVEPMQRFVNAVRSVAPQAVGPPIVILESARAVVDAFQRAFVYSFVAITLLLLVILRKPFDVLLAMLPLVFSGLFTVAGMVLLGISFNFANVIALPLILGVGIDYGVYIVQRGRVSEEAAANLLRSGAARAVLFGALTTIASFGNLVWARHPGTVSLGILLTLGLGLTLICALVFLPSLMAWHLRRVRERAREARI